jgi:hypothetical protein
MVVTDVATLAAGSHGSRQRMRFKVFRFNQLFRRMDRLFDRMEAKFDAMDAMFDAFPDSGFTNWTVTEYGPAEGRQAEPRDTVEYRTLRLISGHAQQQLEESLNLLGMDGWDLVTFYGDCAIFSRAKEGA